MTLIYIILAVIAYIAVGGFVVGITRTKDDAEVVFVCLFWPCSLVFQAVMYIAYWPSKLGETLRAKMKR